MEPGSTWAEPWALPLIITGLATSYYERYSELSRGERAALHGARRRQPVVDLLRASSRRARTRARVRGAITSEMCEDLNDDLARDARRRASPTSSRAACPEFFDWVKMRSHLFRGVTFGTMLRDEAYQLHPPRHVHLERADNTARILDVKYHTCCRASTDVGGAVDYYQWAALLRSVSAFESYRKIYRDVITPLKRRRAADPARRHAARLHACMNAIYEILQALCDEHRLRARAPRRARCTPSCTTARTERDHHARAARVPDRVPRPDRCARRRAEQAFPRTDLPVSAAPRPAPSARSRRIARSSDRRKLEPMTYCVAMLLDAGMVFASDSRTNAGVDHDRELLAR